MDFDREAMLDAFISTDVKDYGKDPGGHADWIEALSAWQVDEGENLDPVTLAQRLSSIWEIGNYVEKEMPKRFQIRAADQAQFPYLDEHGELQAGVVGSYRLWNGSEDPREIACAIVVEVVKAAQPQHNVVLFRKLISKSVLYTDPVTRRLETRFGLARVA